MSELEKKFNKYRKKIFSKSGIGELYERQIRYLYEKNGWRVIPYGIIKGKSYLGRYIICIKKKQLLIVYNYLLIFFIFLEILAIFLEAFSLFTTPVLAIRINSD